MTAVIRFLRDAEWADRTRIRNYLLLIAGGQAIALVALVIMARSGVDARGEPLGTDFVSRFLNYYRVEWGHESAPSDPKAPAGRRDGWPTTPQSIPPMPFTEWPYGGSTAFGVTRTNSVDSPLMAALGNTSAGKALNDAHIQIYGWINAGGNFSTSTVRGGNAPAGYDYNPNTVQLDQAVLYIERLPDTVQKDHVDWGFRVAPIFGENYRYTTAYGLWSDQLLDHNKNYGYDLPMAYGEVFIPQIMEGLMIRFGRYISIPDIEAQLAPNNYMYSHSMTYTFDAFTNTGVNFSLAATKNWLVQLGVTVGSESTLWHVGATRPNPMPNPLFPGDRLELDPGATPSLTAGFRYVSDSGNDSLRLLLITRLRRPIGNNSSMVSWFKWDSRKSCNSVCTGVSRLFKSCASPRDMRPIKSCS